MNVKLLGTGNITSKRANSCVLIDQHILVDCPNGQYKKLLQEDFPFANLDFILITHLHGDRVFDLPFLFLDLYKRKRTAITLVGPSFLEEYVAELMRLAFGKDTGADILQGLRIRYIDVSESPSFMIGNLSIAAFEVDHGNVPECYGYAFRHVATLVVTGESRMCPNLEEWARKSTYFICECGKEHENAFHMDLDTLKDFAIKYPKLTILTTGMSNKMKKKIAETQFYHDNVIVPDDDYELEIM